MSWGLSRLRASPRNALRPSLWVSELKYTHLMLRFNEITYVKSLIECLACGRQTSDLSSFWVTRTLTYMYFNVLVWPMVWLNRKGFCRQVLCPRIWSRDIQKTRWEAHRWIGMGIHWNKFVVSKDQCLAFSSVLRNGWLGEQTAEVQESVLLLGY